MDGWGFSIPGPLYVELCLSSQFKQLVNSVQSIWDTSLSTAQIPSTIVPADEESAEPIKKPKVARLEDLKDDPIADLATYLETVEIGDNDDDKGIDEVDRPYKGIDEVDKPYRV